MNEVGAKELRMEVGKQGLVDLARLQFWCGWDGDPATWVARSVLKRPWPHATPEWKLGRKVLTFSPLKKFRIAPSIISRGEAELFGLSTPRFAIRVYLEHAERPLGFVNARRLATFASQVPSWAERLDEARVMTEVERNLKGRATANDLLRRNRCIADALLRAPKRFEKWTMLQAQLSRAYGEVCGEDTDWAGTPFIRHISVSGGGLCAQATCFMATALLHRTARGVHGLADVTCLVSPDDLDELPLTGLTSKQLSRYFSHEDVGLGAIWQQPQINGNPPREITFRLALRAYLQSGMPIGSPGRGTKKGRCASGMLCRAAMEVHVTCGSIAKENAPAIMPCCWSARTTTNCLLSTIRRVCRSWLPQATNWPM
jgi:hypothetical protein